MKKSELTFTEGFTTSRSQNDNKQMVFDWDKCAEIIKEKLKNCPNLVAEAGLQGDWDYTGGVIFEKGKHTIENYTYLSSNWAIPTLLLYDGDKELNEIECFSYESESRFQYNSKWDDTSLKILNS